MKKGLLKLGALLCIICAVFASESCKKCKECTKREQCGYCQYTSTNVGDTVCPGPPPAGFPVSEYEIAYADCIASSGTWNLVSGKVIDSLTQEICSTNSDELSSDAQALTNQGYQCVDK